MTEQKKKGRRAYLNDFHKDEKGSYVYRGELYDFAGGKEALKKELWVLWGICAAMLAALVAAGCMDAPGMRGCFYVVLPFSVSFVFGISVCFGMWQLARGGSPMRAYLYEKSVGALPHRTLGTMICAAISIAGELIYLFKNGFSEKMSAAIFFLLLETVSFLLAFLLKKRIMQMIWEKRKTKIDKMR